MCECYVCHGTCAYLGNLGNLEYFRCINCGVEFSEKENEMFGPNDYNPMLDDDANYYDDNYHDDEYDYDDDYDDYPEYSDGDWNHDWWHGEEEYY